MTNSDSKTCSGTKRIVLILCTGNSCRSQMMEALINARFGERWTAHSAGTRPAGYVHPLVGAALAEIGIAHAGESKSTDTFRGIPFDLVVTVCDSAAEECPLWLGRGRRIHHGYPDPALQTGSDAEKLEAFRAIRDRMLADLNEILATSQPSLP